MIYKSLLLLIFPALLHGCSGFVVPLPAPKERPSVSPSDARLVRPGELPERHGPAPAAHSELMFRVLTSLGIDYQNGGRSPKTGFDCSGLVAHVYHEAFGLRLPHNTLAQSQSGAPVERDQLTPGDLVFYNTLNRPYSHVGIYLGDGRFVHAPKSGAQVRVEQMQSRYWAGRYSGARRIAMLPLLPDR